MSGIEELVDSYYRQGFMVIPVPRGQKQPAIKWGEYTENRPAPEIVKGLFQPYSEVDKYNIAIICGSVSNGMYVVEFDDTTLAKYYYKRNEDKVDGTRIVRSGGRSLHMYYKAPNGHGKIKSHSFHTTGLPCELRGNGNIVIAPPSMHPSGRQYQWANQNEIATFAPDGMKTIIEDLGDEWRMVKHVAPMWKEGNRDQLTMGITSWMRRNYNYEKDRVKKIVSAICFACADEEEDKRLAQVEREFNIPVEDTAAREYLGNELVGKLNDGLPTNRKPRGRPKGSTKDKQRKNYGGQGGAKSAADSAEEDEQVRYVPYLFCPPLPYLAEMKEIPPDAAKAPEQPTDPNLPPLPGSEPAKPAEEPKERLLWEMILDKGRTYFINRYGERKDEIMCEGVTYRPLPISAEEMQSVTIPNGIEDYGTLDQLYQEMREFALEEFDPGHSKELYDMIVGVSMTSWLLEWQNDMAERFIPMIQAQGASETGKKRFLSVSRYLFYRPMYMVKTTKAPSIFRPLNKYKGTLILDEADLDDSGLASEFIQFVNSRADGVAISRYSTESGDSQWFQSFGFTIMALRKAFGDDGAQSRSIVFYTESTDNPDKYALLPGQPWRDRGMKLQRKLLKFRLDYAATRTNIPTHLSIKDVRGFRVKTSLLMLSAMQETCPMLLKNLVSVCKLMDRRVIEDRSNSPEGLIMNCVYDAIKSDGVLEKKPGGWVIQGTYKNRSGEQEQTVLTLKSLARQLGDAFSPSEISRYLTGLGQGALARDTVNGRRHRGLVLIKTPKRLQKEFYKYVIDAEVLPQLVEAWEDKQKMQQSKLGDEDDTDDNKDEQKPAPVVSKAPIIDSSIDPTDPHNQWLGEDLGLENINDITKPREE